MSDYTIPEPEPQEIDERNAMELAHMVDFNVLRGHPSGDPFAVSNLGGPNAPADRSAPVATSPSSFTPAVMAHVAQAAVQDATAVLNREQDLVLMLQPLAAECNVPATPVPGPAASSPRSPNRENTDSR